MRRKHYPIRLRWRRDEHPDYGYGSEKVRLTCGEYVGEVARVADHGTCGMRWLPTLLLIGHAADGPLFRRRADAKRWVEAAAALAWIKRAKRRWVGTGD